MNTEAEDYTQAEIVRSLKRIDSNVTELRADLRSQAEGYVPRGEFEVWRQGIGREFSDVKGDIDEIRGARAPWWTVVALVLSGVAIIAAALPAIAAATA